MNRRQFLAASLASVAGRLYAAPGTDARFLLVFLRGGYDAANVLVPVGSSFYYEARPNIAIQKNQYDNIFRKGDAISRAPICKGIRKFAKVPLSPPVNTKKTSTVPCIVTSA